MDPIRGLIDVLPAAACVHRDGLVLYANGRFLEVLGFAEVTEVVGVPVETLVREEDRAFVRDRARQLTASSSTASAVPVGWLCRGGDVATMLTSAALVPFEGEGAVVELGPDPRAEALLQARLASSDRLASLGTLAAGVAHEINNPLTYVLSNIDYIREQLSACGPRIPKELLELDEVAVEAKTGGERVARIVRGLRVFSRVDEETRTSTDVLVVLEDAVKMATNEIRHRARLTKRYRPLPSVIADEARLTQVFVNLLVNAAQAIREGRADDNEITVSTCTDDTGRAVVEVRDTGEGIAPEHLPRIFDPFFTTKPQGSGTGLGLSICHGIVNALGGEIVVESSRGAGSLFRVLLPAARAVEESRPPTTRISSTGKGRSGTVLVVDDDATIGTTIARVLGATHRVLALTSGEEALARVRAGERFDLILCDLMMPVLTGMDVYAELQRLAPDQAERVVFLTGGAFTHSAREFLEQVANERFEKPFDAARLRMLVRTMVGTPNA